MTLETERRIVLEHTPPASTPCVFERGSPVHTYWVERCAGFTVFDADGRRRGRVRRADRERSELLVVRRVRSHRVAMAAVQAVSPWERTIQVPELPRRASADVEPASHVSGDTLPWFDLPVGNVAREERDPSPLSRGAERARRFLHIAAARTHDAIRSGVAGARRISSSIGRRANELTHELRARSARALIRVAHAVEPQSHENR